MAAPDGPPKGERFLPGRVLAGRFRVVARIGQGGMGEVYRADDLKLGQPVALKFLPQELSGDAARLSALFAEVRLARQVTHTGVCRVHDVDEAEGMHFLSMEFVDGEDLASLLRRIGRLPPDKATEIAREVCMALAAIHERGVLHRDLKPANLMIDGRGHARITDFGLAELKDTSADPEMIVGTPAYMAPECLVGGQPTVQSDLYGLGLILYEMFTGRQAFEVTTFQELVRQRRETTPVSPAKHHRDIDPRVEEMILRCLEWDPERRPRSAFAVAAALPGGDPISNALAAGNTPSPDVVAAATTRAEGLHPAVAWPCAGLLVAGLLALALVAPHTQLVSALSLPEPPEAMAGRARELLRGLRLAGPAADRAYGYGFDDAIVDEVVAHDRSRERWRHLAETHPQVVTFWYREHSGELLPSAPRYQASYTDPPLASGGMVGLQLDGRGHLRRLDAPAKTTPGDASSGPFDPSPLFQAAALDLADFSAVPPTGVPLAAGDQRLAYEGHDPEHPSRPLRVEIVAFRGRPVSFLVHESAVPVTGATATDPSGHTASLMLRTVRPALYLAAMLLGAWLARRNLRAGRGDTKRAIRLGIALMTVRIAVWAFGGHHTLGSSTQQLTTALAWGLYDLAYGWLIYVAIEPYLRRLWPRWLTSWARLLDGQIGDPRVGRDLLIGCLVGTGIALAVAAHQAGPALLGAPPGRPDNVGYVENQLTALLGLRDQLADLLTLARSNIVLLMGFVVILVMARLVTRSAPVALAAAFLIFTPLGLPKGEIAALNWALAIGVTLVLLWTIARFGLLAVGVALVSYAVLEAAPLGLGFGSWAAPHAVLVPAMVLAVGGYGFFRALGGRPAFRNLLAGG